MFPLNVVAATGHQYIFTAGTDGADVGYSALGGGTGSIQAGDFPQRGFNLVSILIQVTTDLWILRLQDENSTTPPADSDDTWRECVISGVFDSGQNTVSWLRAPANYSTQALGSAQWTLSDPGVPLMVDGNQYFMQLLL